MILLCSLLIIIVCHELGHLWAAKLCKCGVTRFSIGFGKPLFKFMWHKTSYEVAPILLGGFCSLKGEIEYSRSKYAFTNKTYSQKVFISLAGILVNVITAIIAYGLFLVTYNDVFYIFAFYSLAIGLSNGLPIPCLDGSFPIAFLFEKKLGKKRLYSILGSLFPKWFFWLMVLNVLSIPYLGYLLWTGQIL